MSFKYLCYLNLHGGSQKVIAFSSLRDPNYHASHSHSTPPPLPPLCTPAKEATKLCEQAGFISLPFFPVYGHIIKGTMLEQE